MKNLRFVMGAALCLSLYSNAEALEWQCGKTIEYLPVLNTESTSRPTLLYKVLERKDGSVIKQYKPLGATNEKTADFLASISGTTKVCLKYYDPMLPPPVPLMLIDIELDNQ